MNLVLQANGQARQGSLPMTNAKNVQQEDGQIVQDSPLKLSVKDAQQVCTRMQAQDRYQSHHATNFVLQANIRARQAFLPMTNAHNVQRAHIQLQVLGRCRVKFAMNLVRLANGQAREGSLPIDNAHNV